MRRQVPRDKLPGHRWVDADVGLEAEEVVLAPQAASMLDPSSVTSSPRPTCSYSPEGWSSAMRDHPSTGRSACTISGRRGNQCGHPGDCRLEMVGVHVGLACCGVTEGLDQEVHAGVVGAAGPLEG